MKVICLLLCILSLTTAKVHPRPGVNDVLDGVEGVLYDIPEYEDPEISLFKLIAKGIMPVYTIRDVIKETKDLSNKDDKPHYQTDDIKKGLDSVITQLQEAKNKLENGNNAIYLDIDKSVLSLENLKHNLFLDLHSAAASSTQSPTYFSVAESSSNKPAVDRYSIIRASIAKYLPSDYPVYKYFSFDIPTAKPLASKTSAGPFFNPDSALVPYPLSEVSSVQSSADDFPAEQSSDTISSKDQSLPSGIEHPLDSDATTEYLPVDKAIYKYDFLGAEIPDEAEKEMKTGVVVTDDESSPKSDKIEQGEKTFMQKKWSMKLSSTF